MTSPAFFLQFSCSPTTTPRLQQAIMSVTADHSTMVSSFPPHLFMCVQAMAMSLQNNMIIGAQGQRYKRRPFEIPTVNLCTNPHSSRHHVTGSTGSHVDGNRGSKSSRNTLALIGNPELSQQLSEIGTLQLPTPQQWLTGIRGEDKGKRVSSASSFRAKQGFKYWPQDAVKPSVRTMGAKGTFLGIEMPRL